MIDTPLPAPPVSEHTVFHARMATAIFDQHLRFAAFAIGMYTLASTRWYEADFIAAGFNMLMVIVTWRVVNRIVHARCVDENRPTGGIGMLRGTAPRYATGTKLACTAAWSSRARVFRSVL